MRIGAGLVTLIAIFVSACSTTTVASSGDGGAADAGSPDQACNDLARARCAKIAACSATVLAIRYGDAATCQGRETANCLAALAAPSTGNSPAASEACATALGGNVDCGAFLVGGAPPECAPKVGTVAAGGTCAFSGQCASSYCGVGPTSVCGTCAGAPPSGAPCDTQFCPPGLECGTVSKTCGAPAQLGAACDTASCAPGLVCAGTAGSKTCQAIASTAAAGQPCGIVNGGHVVCAAEGFCKVAQGATSGTCLAAAADGAPCDDTNGPRCLTPARCVAGTCQTANATACH